MTGSPVSRYRFERSRPIAGGQTKFYWVRIASFSPGTPTYAPGDLPTLTLTASLLDVTAPAIQVEVPAKIVGSDHGRPLVKKLGRGGSARLRPLVLADGFAEIPADAGELPTGAAIAFHPFQAAFAP